MKDFSILHILSTVNLTFNLECNNVMPRQHGKIPNDLVRLVYTNQILSIQSRLTPHKHTLTILTPLMIDYWGRKTVCTNDTSHKFSFLGLSFIEAHPFTIIFFVLVVYRVYIHNPKCVCPGMFRII